MKVKLLAAFFIWFFLFANKANAQWQTIFQDSLNYNFTSVYFLNNDTGFVAGVNLIPFFDGGTILRTLDGGQTWDTSFIPLYLVAISFPSDSVGFAGGENGYTCSTNDMGENWNNVSQLWNADYTSLHFLNNQVGYFCAADDGLLCRTTDGADNWQIIYTSSGESYFPGSSKFFFVDSLIGFLAQATHDGWQSGYDGSTVAKTTDGGLTWTDLNIPSNFYPYSCYFFDSIIGVAVGKYGHISKTYDGGITWSNPDSLGPYPLYDIYFVTDSIGYIMGGNNLYELQPPNGIIYKSIDGGTTWQVMDSSYFDGLLKMHFPSDSVGYAVGMNGIILKISNANSVSSSVQIVSNYKNNISIFPNPASDQITINSQNIPINKIEIINLFGETVVSQSPSPPGRVGVGLLPSGIYILKAYSEKETFQQKLIIAR